MIAENQIREQLSRYLEKKVSLDQFEDWLVQRSWNMHRESDEAARKLAGAIELRLAEHSSGHLDDQQLRAELVPLLTKYMAAVAFGGEEKPLPVADSQNTPVSPRVFVVRAAGQDAQFQPLVDISRVAECA